MREKLARQLGIALMMAGFLLLLAVIKAHITLLQQMLWTGDFPGVGIAAIALLPVGILSTASGHKLYSSDKKVQ